MSSRATRDDHVGDTVPLAEILCTAELERDPPPVPDYEAENRALQTLAQALADDPENILQTLADTLLAEFKAHSAGISLLAADGQSFYWPAIAGEWRPHLGGGTPRDFGPCGDVLDQNQALMFRHWERRYPYLREATPLAEQGLLVPFYVSGRAVGTIWTIAHDDSRKFDTEDLRQLRSLGRFASAAYQATETRKLEIARQAAVARAEHEKQLRRALEEINADLRESEERYRIVFESGPLAIYTCNAAGVIDSFNSKATELWGRVPDPGERLSGAHKIFRADLRPIHPDEHPVATAMKTGAEMMGQRLIFERTDGSRRYIVANVRPILRNGGVVGAINWFYEVVPDAENPKPA